MQRRDILGMYCMGLVVIFLIILIYASLQVDAYDPQSEVFPRTHEVKCVELTYQEAQELMQIAQAEAGNQGEDGMWLIMSVVLNRVSSSEFPDNIHDVIFQECQFYTKGMTADVSPECHEALARIEKGDIAPQIVAFEKTTNKTLDKYFCSAFEYRSHCFYTLKK